MRRRLKITAIGLACGLTGLGALAVAGRIEPFLPGEGASRCFAGNYDGTTALTFGFPHEKRNEQAHITRLVLRLDRQPGQEPHRDPTSPYQFDWRYDLRLMANSSDRGDFKSYAQCDWNVGPLSHLVPSIFCFIDCDGGGIEIARVQGRSAVDMIWDAEGWLRMSACGGGGEILRAGGNTKTFRLKAVPNEVCKDLPPEGD